MALVMRTTGHRTISGRLRVVAMTMEQLPVGVAVLPTGRDGHHVVDFHPVSMANLQSTPAAPTLLPSQQDAGPSRQPWLAAKSAAPIRPVPIIRAAAALHLDVPLDRGRAVPGQLRPGRWSEVPGALIS